MAVSFSAQARAVFNPFFRSSANSRRSSGSMAAGFLASRSASRSDGHRQPLAGSCSPSGAPGPPLPPSAARRQTCRRRSCRWLLARVPGPRRSRGPTCPSLPLRSRRFVPPSASPRIHLDCFAAAPPLPRASGPAPDHSPGSRSSAFSEMPSHRCQSG